MIETQRVACFEHMARVAVGCDIELPRTQKMNVRSWQRVGRARARAGASHRRAGAIAAHHHVEIARRAFDRASRRSAFRRRSAPSRAAHRAHARGRPLQSDACPRHRAAPARDRRPRSAKTRLATPTSASYRRHANASSDAPRGPAAISRVTPPPFFQGLGMSESARMIMASSEVPGELITVARMPEIRDRCHRVARPRAPMQQQTRLMLLHRERKPRSPSTAPTPRSGIRRAAAARRPSGTGSA